VFEKKFPGEPVPNIRFGFHLQSIRYNVPEPATLGLFALGLLLTFTSRRVS
jgi:hypothetical protein